MASGNTLFICMLDLEVAFDEALSVNVVAFTLRHDEG